MDNIKNRINRNTKQLPSIALAKMNEKVWDRVLMVESKLMYIHSRVELYQY